MDTGIVNATNNPQLPACMQPIRDVTAKRESAKEKNSNANRRDKARRQVKGENEKHKTKKLGDFFFRR